MPNITKANNRDRKRNKAQHGMRVRRGGHEAIENRKRKQAEELRKQNGG